MSVRSERPNVNDLAESMATSTIKTDLDANHVNATIAAAQQADSSLAEANSISTNHPEHPLSRSIQVNIRATLGDLCLRKNKATWAPSAEALRNIPQQKKFTSLNFLKTKDYKLVFSCLRLMYMLLDIQWVVILYSLNIIPVPI